MQRYLLAALVAANFILACESSSTTTATNDATFAAPDTEVLNDANGPTKPEPVDLGTYSVLWANWTPPDESTIGMFNEFGTVSVTYQPAFEDKPAAYSINGEALKLTCHVTEDRKVNCDTWTTQTGGLFDGTGEFMDGDAEATLKVDITDFVGTADETHKYRVYKLTRQ